MRSMWMRIDKQMSEIDARDFPPRSVGAAIENADGFRPRLADASLGLAGGRRQVVGYYQRTDRQC
jgi:hypothetical protein